MCTLPLFYCPTKGGEYVENRILSSIIYGPRPHRHMVYNSSQYLLACTGVTERWRVLSYTRKTVRWLALSRYVGEHSSILKLASVCLSPHTQPGREATRTAWGTMCVCILVTYQMDCYSCYVYKHTTISFFILTQLCVMSTLLYTNHHISCCM